MDRRGISMLKLKFFMLFEDVSCSKEIMWGYELFGVDFKLFKLLIDRTIYSSYGASVMLVKNCGVATKPIYKTGWFIKR